MKNREFKFRVWDDRLLKFNYFDFTSVIGRLPNDCLTNIQQFTSLLDKNGKEIYEGDIIKLFSDPDELYEVVYNSFDNDTVGFLLEANHGRSGWFNSKSREIIGNIFENSELLKA